MSIRTFLNLVEIKTKIASLFPFLLGLLFVLYRYGTLDYINTILFFSSMLIFDLTATAINQYMDYRKATSDSYRKERNIIGQAAIPERLVITTIISMLAISSALGIWLVSQTDLLVLFIGMLCFAVGIFYTFGPIPLSRMPLGEVFSGVTMGFGILFLTVYVNAFDKGIANISWQGSSFLLKFDILLLLEIGLVSLPCVLTIANLMLANNICDLEEDIANHRYTLPFYIGKKYAIWLFNILYIVTFIAISIAALLGILPKALLLSLLMIKPVYSHVDAFNQKQSKTETFPLAGKNLVLVNGTIAILMLIVIAIPA